MLFSEGYVQKVGLWTPDITRLQYTNDTLLLVPSNSKSLVNLHTYKVF